jgi:hypothetical protein
MQTTENTAEIKRLRMDLGSVEKQMSDVMEQLGDVVTKSELAEMMNGFVNDEDNGWRWYRWKRTATLQKDRADLTVCRGSMPITAD